MAQDGLQDASKMAQDASKTAQQTPKTPQDEPQEAKNIEKPNYGFCMIFAIPPQSATVAPEGPSRAPRGKNH